MAEQLVGQQLLSAGIGSENGRLFYWARETRGSSAEVDYVIVRNGAIHPVEVKSGATGKLKSMSIFLKEHPAAGNGIVLSASWNTMWYRSIGLSGCRFIRRCKQLTNLDS